MSCTRAKRSRELEETDRLTRTGATENEQKTDNERQNEAKEQRKKRTATNKQSPSFEWADTLLQTKRRFLHMKETPSLNRRNALQRYVRQIGRVA